MCRVSTIFNWIIISSGTAIVITAIILFVKQVFKNKQNANWHYYIWFILVIRLLVPCTLVSSISIFNAITPSIEKVSTTNANKLLAITEKEIIENKENTEVSNDFTPNKENITSDILIQNESNIVNRFSSKFSLKFKLMTIPNSEKITLGYSLNNKKADKTTSQIAKEKNAVGAVNAGRFNEDLSPAGFMVVNGKVVFNESKNENTKQNTVGFTTKGKLLVGSYTLAQLKDLGIKDAIASCGAALIINGKPIRDDISLGINARTAIGQKSDGTVLMLVVDGRNMESIGAKIEDVIDILSKNGAVNACLLDGGSSSTMYFSGNIVNHPCNEKSKERIVPSAFVVLQ